MSIQLTLAARYMTGRKLRTFLTTLAVIFGVTIVFGLNGLLPAFAEAFRQNMMASAGKIDLAVTGAAGGTFEAAAMAAVRSVGGIEEATPVLRQNVLLPAGQAVNAVIVVGVEPESFSQVRPHALVLGRYLQADDKRALVISEKLAEQAGLKVSDTFTLPSAVGTTDFTVVGIIAAQGVLDMEEVYMPLSDAQALFNQPGRINTIEARFAAPADRAQVAAAVQAQLGDRFKLGEIEAGSQFLSALTMGQIVLNVFGVLALAMGGFVILNTFRTVVAERRRDIGMLRALGATRGTVVGIILTESLLQGLLGTAIGMMIGAGLAYSMIGLIRPIFEQFLHMTFTGRPVFDIPVFLWALGLGVGITVLSGLLPAWSASRVTPLEALRPMVGAAAQRAARRGAWIGAGLIGVAALTLISGEPKASAAGAFLVLIGLVLAGPALVRPIALLFGRLLTVIFAREGQIAQGNMARQPGRAAITASAMMIGLALIIACAGMMSSMEEGIGRYLAKSMGSDFLLMPASLVLGGGNMGASPDLAQAIRKTPGVQDVTTLRLANSETKGTALQLVGIDPETFARVGGMEFMLGSEAQIYQELAQGRGIILNGVFAVRNPVQLGEWITLKTPDGERAYQVLGVGSDLLNAKAATGFISQANLAADFHESNDLLLMVNKTPEAETAVVRGALDELMKQYPALTVVESTEWRETMMGMFNNVVGSLYFVLIALALPSLIALVNTLAINVIERTREIGVIRAVGGTRRQVQRMILAESLLLAILGIAFGILAGLWLGYALVGAVSIVGFKLVYFFPASSVLIATAVGLIFGVIAALLPARQAAQLQIVRALRYE
ncbi:MAG TPA: FtsX-like permease family protein [Anaerolineae bacterium]|nr:FtsX-like permease family protein [Anaerolineae bacterium]